MTFGLLSAPTSDLPTHTEVFGPIPRPSDSSSLYRALTESGLTGRGGAGFPAAHKLAAATGRRAVVIANGSEGEPLSHKDATLLTHAPHLVIDGLLLVADATDSTDVYLYAPADQLRAVRHALDEREVAGWSERAIRLVESPESFIGGENSAVVNKIAGGRAIPQDRIGHLAETGLRGRPTVLYNVETLAHMALIARFGAAWFASRGMNGEPGTMLVTLSGDIGFARVAEVPLGIRLDHLLAQYSNTDPSELRAVLVGGYHGGWVDAQELSTILLTRSSLNRIGVRPGAGVIHGLSDRQCGLRVSADILDYLAGQSAHQCGPCSNGLPRLAHVVRDLALGRQTTGAEDALRLANIVDGRGACRHPDGTATFVRSVIRVFGRDINFHAHGNCERQIRQGVKL